MRFYETPVQLIEEQDQFEKDIVDFSKGIIHPVKFKGIRVAHGIYEQRQEHTYMVRIRCAACGITPTQLKKVAELAEKYGSSEVHFTTRSEVQIHEVLIQDVMTVIRQLHQVGLSTRGGGGNTIRNILTSPNSGIDPLEVFDVEPYAIALTTRLIAEPDSWNLPRKFKIAFSNSPQDTAYTQATCLGFVAKIQNGKKGFSVYCAGGMGAKPMVGHLLIEFLPDYQVYHVAKALKVMFDKHGNRRSKTSSRLKFLWKKLDRSEFLRLFHEEFDKIQQDRSLDLVLPLIENKANSVSFSPDVLQNNLHQDHSFQTWKNRYVFTQKQEGFSSVLIPLRLGDLLKSDADLLCDFLMPFGDNLIRCDRSQNIRLRNIPTAYLPSLFNVLTKMKQTLIHTPFVLGNMINCTGAQTCKLGICLPRGLSDEIRESLTASQLPLDEISDFKIHMSGCPNTCGMHHVADLGFFGKIGRKEGDIYPAYNVLLGAKRGEGLAQYAERHAEIAAKFIPEFVVKFLKVYLEKKAQYDHYQAFLQAEGIALAKQLCEDYKQVPSYHENPSFYQDFGAKRRLSLEDMGTAECSAGMFDMINVDKKEIEFLQSTSTDADSELVYRLAFHTARMLLVTRGLDAKTDEQVFDHFSKHFITTEIVPLSFLDVMTLAKLGLKEELFKHKQTVLSLAACVLELYQHMDDSLRFKTELKQEQIQTFEKDFRGVMCPMNFVKTKLALSTMKSGEKLQILLDDGEPIQNVPNSIKLEGHKILNQVQLSQGHWQVLIEKS